jgi:putative ABC transport system permease protein
MGFRGTRPTSHTEIWLPITLQPVAIPRMSVDILRNRASGWIRIFGRRKSGISLATSQVEVDTVAARLAHEYPVTNQARTMRLYPGAGLDSDDRAALWNFLSLLLASVVLLQLIACANVANLLLARAAERRREFAVRRALGASTGHLLRMFLTEGALLAVFPVVIGVLLAPALAQALVSIQQPAFTFQGLDLQTDWRVLGFTLLLTVFTALVFACAPALQTSRVDLVTPLKDETQGGTPSKSRMRGLLVASQLALSLLLLSVAGSTARTMGRALSANPIDDAGHVMVYRFDLGLQGYSPQKGRAFYENLLRRITTTHGVSSASLAFTLPPEEWPSRRSVFYPGQEPPPDVLQGREFELGLRVDVDTVAPRFFATLGLPLTRGRDFDARDADAAPRVTIINEKLAERLWPGENPLGKRIAAPAWEGPRQPPAEVIGVTKDVRSRSLLSDTPLQLYLPLAQEYDGRMGLVVRSTTPPQVLGAAVREAVKALDPAIPIVSSETMEQHIAASLWQQRMATGVIGSFGMLAIFLAGMGLYAVVANSVTERTREVGIRMALGAQPAQVRILMVKQGMAWLLGGVVVGFPLALAGSMTMKKWIAGAGSNDAASLGVSLAVLAAVGLLACYLPARRASQVDPNVVLRHY